MHTDGVNFFEVRGQCRGVSEDGVPRSGLGGVFEVRDPALAGQVSWSAAFRLGGLYGFLVKSAGVSIRGGCMGGRGRCGGQGRGLVLQSRLWIPRLRSE